MDYTSIPWSSSIDDYDMTSKLRSNLYRGRLPPFDIDLYIRAVLIPEKAQTENVLARFHSLCAHHPLLPKVIHSFFSEKRLIIISPHPQTNDPDDGEFLDTVRSMDEFAVAAVLKQVVNLLVFIHETTDWCDLRPAQLWLRKGLLGVNLFSPRSISRCVSRDSQPFLAPELARGQAPPNSFKGDIWSLGATALYLFMGPESKELSPCDIPKHISDLECSKEFKSFLEACLQIDPELRPSAKELSENLFLHKKRSTEIGPSVGKKTSQELSENPFRSSSSNLTIRTTSTHSPDVVISTMKSVFPSQRRNPSTELPPKTHETQQSATGDVILKTGSGRLVHVPLQNDVLLSTQGFDSVALQRSLTDSAISLSSSAKLNPFSGSGQLNMIFESVAKKCEEDQKTISSGSSESARETDRIRPLSLSLESLRQPRFGLSLNIEALSPKKGHHAHSPHSETLEKLDSERTRRKKKKATEEEKEKPIEKSASAPHPHDTKKKKSK